MRTPWLLMLLVVILGCGDDDDSNGATGTGNPDGVSNSCGEDADCETGECYIGRGGGYCTTVCMDEGSTEQCPLDTVCKPIQGGARRCLLVCGSDSACDFTDCETDYCPSGSSCVSIDGTTHQACEPSPS